MYNRANRQPFRISAKCGLFLLTVGLLVGCSGVSDAKASSLSLAQEKAQQTFPLNCSVQVVTGGLNDPSRQGEAWFPCEIHLQPGWWGWGRERLCSLVVHEQGHLFGREHSEDPDDVMHPGAPAGPQCSWIDRAEWRREDVIDGIVDTRGERRSKRRTKRLKRLRRELRVLNRRLHI